METKLSVPESELWMNIEQASKYVGISHFTLRKYCKDGKVQYTKLGNKIYRFKKEWLDSFIDSTSIQVK